MSSTGSLTIQAGTILIMQDDRREDSTRRQPLRLPVIAPKDDYSSSASSSRNAQRPGAGSVIPPRSRLPPRSRSGCWTCRSRKVKCDGTCKAFEGLCQPRLPRPLSKANAGILIFSLDNQSLRKLFFYVCYRRLLYGTNELQKGVLFAVNV